MTNPQALALADKIERCGVLTIGHAAGVTLTVADGVDLGPVGQLFGQRHEGIQHGAWLVPENDPKGREHYHGLVVGPDLQAVVPTWQRCGGGIERAQRVDPVRPGDRMHLRKVVAYTMKLRNHPGPVVATGLLAMPWTFVCEARESGQLDGEAEPFSTAIPSRLPPAPDMNDDAWLAEIQHWPPDAHEALAERAEELRRLGCGTKRERAYWAYRALRASLATTPPGLR